MYQFSIFALFFFFLFSSTLNLITFNFLNTQDMISTLIFKTNNPFTHFPVELLICNKYFSSFVGLSIFTHYKLIPLNVFNGFRFLNSVKFFPTVLSIHNINTSFYSIFTNAKYLFWFMWEFPTLSYIYSV